MFRLESKQGQTANFRTALETYIQTHYAKTPGDFLQDFQTIEDYREMALHAPMDHDGLVSLEGYYQVLCVVQSRFPIDENNIKISFAWKNAFPNDHRLISSFNLDYEKAAILFNMGVIHSNLGDELAAENVRMACNHYQKAAGCFQHIYQVLGTTSIETDLSNGCLKSMTLLVMAKAHECFFVKGMQEGVKDPNLAKIASSCSELYEQAYYFAKEFAAAFGTKWLAELLSKSRYYMAYAQHKRANEAGKETRYGEQVGRLQISECLCRKGLELRRSISETMAVKIQDLLDHVSRELVQASRDNDLIYHEPIPDSNVLQQVQVVELVSPILFDSQAKIPRLFSGLVPDQVLQAISEYNKDRDAVVNFICNECAQLEELSRQLEAKMNTKGMMEEWEQPQRIPSLLAERARDLEQQNAVIHLGNLVDELTEHNTKTQESLNQTSRLLQNEKAFDQAMEAEFPDRWKKTASIELRQAMADRFQTYLDMHTEAGESDRVLVDRYRQCIGPVGQLCLPQEELEKLIPPPSLTNPQDNLAFRGFKKLVKELYQSREEIQKLASTARSEAECDDIETRLMVLYSKTNHTLPKDDQDRIFCQELEKYRKWAGQVDHLKQSHGQLFVQIKLQYDRLATEQYDDPLAKQRNAVIQSLYHGYCMYKDLVGSFLQGVEFYKNLDKLVSKLRMDLDTFCHNREIERRNFTGWCSHLTSSSDPGSWNPLWASKYSGDPPPVPSRQDKPKIRFQ